MNLHGVALVDKPAGMSSFSVVSRLRRVFKSVGVTKAGHTGTLDPLATGLLPICIGESTKYAQRLLDSDKGYRAIIQLGVATTTGDAEGEITARSDAKVDAAALATALQKSRGPIVQIPPIYSALKIAGKPAYEYARAGQAVEIAPRSVTIHELNLLAFDEQAQRVTIDVRCSKGTYIRTLAIDLALALDNVGHLLNLQRTLTGGFSLAQAKPLDAWMEADDATRVAWLLPTDQLVADLPSLTLDTQQSVEIRQGKVVHVTAPTSALDTPVTAPEPLLRLYEPSGAFLGLGSLDATHLLRAERLLNTASR
jgi:tRNA pseudouridine55 synthase